MSFSRLCQFALCGVLFAVVAVSVPAQDWTQWRGPNRDGVIRGFTEPKAWPEALKQKWKVTVGEGHSSPLVAGSRVFQLARQGSKEVVACFDLDSGKQIWQDAYEVTWSMGMSTRVIVGKHKQGPRATPVLSGGRLYTFGVGGVLTCYDAAAGKVIWRKETRGQFRNAAPEFGAAMSPIVDRGLVIAHVGGDGGGALTAFDAGTGAVKWQWAGDGPAYSSPVIAEFHGTRQIITQSQSHIISIWPENGGLLWKLPFTTDYEQNSVTPLVYRDTVILSGLDRGVFAVRPKYAGGQWTAEQVWKNDQVAMYLNSPILSGNLLFGMSHKNKGQFFCLDAATGKTWWTGDGRQGENAAMEIAGNIMFWLTNDAELIVSRLTNNRVEPVRRYKVADSETWAHPVITGNRVLIKDNQSLALWSLE
ncbi:MAG TPA: PQQ-binding-like beta-propeller repeat protein [Blastocatellia bacterium]|nr:PQQ-binding-like beta-propeller repeat protein [Blastocatellia bacterium]